MVNSNQIARFLRLLFRDKGGKQAIAFLLVGLSVAYLFLQPTLIRSVGISLPNFGGREQASVDLVTPTPRSNGQVGYAGLTNPRVDLSEAGKHAKRGSGVELSSGSASQPPRSFEKQLRKLKGTLLTEVQRNTYVSTAGLVYTRGSQEGHRLKHIMKHTEDMPNRPGRHGVFQTNNMEQLIELLDEAFQKAGVNEGTDSRREQIRTIHTVDMGRSVGYVGGQVGNRNGKPVARHIRMVLEENRIITAYPLRP